MHILLIDGDASLQTALRRLFGRSHRIGFVATAVDGRAALERDRVDLLLLEARLPDGNGLDMLTEIRRRWPQLPIVLLTAFGSERICAEAFRRGARDYLSKPVDRESLRRAVQLILDEISAAAHSRPSMEASGVGRELAPIPVSSIADRVQQAARFVEEHHAERLSLHKIARLVNLGPFTLSHAFKAELKTSIRSFQQHVRVSKAQRLLRDRRFSITEVALLVGYNDLARFDKMFKKLTGMAPSDYRRLPSSEQEPPRDKATNY